MKAEELMTTDLEICREGDSLNTVAELLASADCGALPVVDAGGHLVGMITDRDVMLAAHRADRALSTINVADAVNGRVYAASGSDSLHVVQRIMREQQVRRLPIVSDDDDKVVGILSLNDLAREAVREARAQEKRAITATELLETLAAVGESAAKERRPHLPGTGVSP